MVVVLEYTVFQVFPTPNNYPRFTTFRRSYVNHPAVTLIKVTLLVMCCSKWRRSSSYSCLFPMTVHLRNLFLLSTPIARMLLTLRWIKRPNKVRWLSINISKLEVGVKHSISRRTTLSLNRFLPFRQPIFLSLHLDMV